jgi:hypothetical protein
MPGLVGLNNMKANDYANAVVQVLARVNPIRWAVCMLIGSSTAGVMPFHCGLEHVRVLPMGAVVQVLARVNPIR